MTSSANILPNAGSDDMAAILGRQKAAFAQDMAPDRETRDDRLARLVAMLERDADMFSDLISHDFGNRPSVVFQMGDLMAAQGAIRHTRSHLKRWMKPERVATGKAFLPARSRILRQPLGVVGIISPWNYPLQLAISPLVGVLAAGNRAILKPSEFTPLFSEALKASIAKSFAENEVAVVTGGAEVGQAFAALPFDHLVFTGSTKVGRLVAEAAARNLTPVTLELGGKSPVIVDPSADLALTADRLAWGKLFNAGQTCIAPDYALVPRDKVDGFVDALRGSVSRHFPTIKDNPDYTSIVHERHVARLYGLVDDARSRGARIVPLGSAEGDPATRKVAPIALLDVTDAMRVMQEEIFGPLMPIVPYDTLDEAIAYINARPRPLGLYWFGSDAANEERVLSRTISGGVVTNDTMLHCLQDNLPFGGVGASGMGHYHGEYGFRQFSKEKPVFFQTRFAGGKMLYPPYTPLKLRMAKLLARWG